MRRFQRLISVIIVLLALVGGVGYVVYTRTSDKAALITDEGDNISDYSAVFMVNGQVYFGKLYREDEILDLRDIYYLKSESTTDTTKQTQETGSNVPFSLVKLGEELHGPNDRMRITRDQVLFVESLKKDSKVVEAIIADKK